MTRTDTVTPITAPSWRTTAGIVLAAGAAALTLSLTSGHSTNTGQHTPVVHSTPAINWLGVTHRPCYLAAPGDPAQHPPSNDSASEPGPGLQEIHS